MADPTGSIFEHFDDLWKILCGVAILGALHGEARWKLWGIAKENKRLAEELENKRDVGMCELTHIATREFTQSLLDTITAGNNQILSEMKYFRTETKAELRDVHRRFDDHMDRHVSGGNGRDRV